MKKLLAILVCVPLAACGAVDKTADTVNTGAKTASTIAVIGAAAAGASTIVAAAAGG